MGSLGDKFKKLAGDQTRQLLQNFQNAQSSKTRNGYSYGKLNEDGTATLADGTVVQVEVKGRPGQYAPVFNLGNGQGLVDQPEAKFFNVDSNVKTPWMIVVVRKPIVTTIANEPPVRIYVVNLKTEEEFDIPPSMWPGVEGYRGGLQFPIYIDKVDFSLDGRHIVLVSASAPMNQSVIPFGDVKPTCPSLNYVIISNWRVENNTVVTDSLVTGTVSNVYDYIDRSSNYFKSSTDPIGASVIPSSADLIIDNYRITAQYVPIVTTNTDNSPKLDFFITIDSKSGGHIFVFASEDPPGRVYTSVSSYRSKTIVLKGINLDVVEEEVIIDFTDSTDNYNQYILGTTQRYPYYYSAPNQKKAILYMGSVLEDGSSTYILGDCTYDTQGQTITIAFASNAQNIVPAQVANFRLYRNEFIGAPPAPNEIIDSFPSGVVLTGSSPLIYSLPLDAQSPRLTNSNFIMGHTKGRTLLYKDLIPSLSTIYPGISINYQYGPVRVQGMEGNVFTSQAPLGFINANGVGTDQEYADNSSSEGRPGDISCTKILFDYAFYNRPFPTGTSFLRFGGSKPSAYLGPSFTSFLLYDTYVGASTFKLVETKLTSNNTYETTKVYDVNKYFNENVVPGERNPYNQPYDQRLLNYAIVYR